MEETTLTIYETYFKNYDNWKLRLFELPFHNCLFCKNNKKYNLVKHCKQDMAKYVIMYLDHLKVYRCCWEKTKYFINSIKISNFCDEDVIGKWSMKYWIEKDIYILLHF